MLVPLVALLLISMNEEPRPTAEGTILGVVVNGSQGGQPIADAEVHLRAGTDGMLKVVETTKTDIYGKFAFERLPIDQEVIYLPGANRDGVHYPAGRIRLDPSNRIAHATIMAFDAVSTVSPLTAAHHDIDVEVEKQMMKVRETLLVSNPSRTTYVGHSQGAEGPVSLSLSIPANFDRLTFDSEFYGRRFRIVDHRVVTDIPWPPGDKELAFTYRIPLEQSAGLLQRPLDLPSSHVRLRVKSNDGQQVSCNLSPSSRVGDDLVFAAVDKQIPAGYTIQLQIGNLPIPWMLYARWASFGVLCVLVFGTLGAHRLRRAGQQRIAARGKRRDRRAKLAQRAA
jgi:hypothetical protein